MAASTCSDRGITHMKDIFQPGNFTQRPSSTAYPAVKSPKSPAPMAPKSPAPKSPTPNFSAPPAFLPPSPSRQVSNQPKTPSSQTFFSVVTSNNNTDPMTSAKKRPAPTAPGVSPQYIQSGPPQLSPSLPPPVGVSSGGAAARESELWSKSEEEQNRYRSTREGFRQSLAQIVVGGPAAAAAAARRASGSEGLGSPTSPPPPTPPPPPPPPGSPSYSKKIIPASFPPPPPPLPGAFGASRGPPPPPPVGPPPPPPPPPLLSSGGYGKRSSLPTPPVSPPPPPPPPPHQTGIPPPPRGNHRIAQHRPAPLVIPVSNSTSSNPSTPMSPSYRPLSSPITPSRPAPPPPPPPASSPLKLPVSENNNQHSPKTSDGASSLLSQATSMASSGYHSENDPPGRTETYGRRSSSTMGNVTEETITMTFDDADSEEGDDVDGGLRKDVFNDKDNTYTKKESVEHHVESPRLIYKEYQGEDFSKYLQDDTDDIYRQQQETYTEKRYRKRASSQGAVLESAEYTTMQRKAGLKEKISKVFTLSRRPKNHDAGRVVTNIHNFSYVDSKNFEMTGKDQPGDYVDFHSDIGGGTRDDSLWGNDTLSARSIRAHSDIGGVRGKKKKSKSTPNLAEYYSPVDSGDKKEKKSDKKGGLWSMFTNKRNKNKNKTQQPPSRDDLQRKLSEDIRL